MAVDVAPQSLWLGRFASVDPTDEVHRREITEQPTAPPHVVAKDHRRRYWRQPARLTHRRLF